MSPSTTTVIARSLTLGALALSLACHTPAPKEPEAGSNDGSPADEAATTDAPASSDDSPALARDPHPDERHFASLRQLTFGGENAEAYLSFAEDRLIFQSTREGLECDQIFTMMLDGSDVSMLSSGKGRTTCAYYLPGDEKILYASTHAADDGCLPPPDRSKGYVWKLYDEFDIYIANADGSGVEVLAASAGYDAEATVSPAGDKIVFTSTRDGDPEIYLMNLDGSGVTRLTNAPGYDGGAFFSVDGSKIVWRANRPKGDDEQAKYDELRTEGLVRPTALELMVMNADGSEQHAITANGAANFGPFWHPDGRRIIFSSNLGDEHGREFDLFMVDAEAGPEQDAEQITHTEQFDGFPMFTRDGKQLIFASNRHHDNEGDTNVFIADWVD